MVMTQDRGTLSWCECPREGGRGLVRVQEGGSGVRQAMVYLCDPWSRKERDGGMNWQSYETRGPVRIFLQSQKAVAAYLKSKQWLPFGFARHTISLTTYETELWDRGST